MEEITEPTQKLSYYQRNKEHARAKAKEYYQRVTEGKVGRRNEKRPPPSEPKKPRGRPRKIVVMFRDAKHQADVDFVHENGAYKSPEDNRDVIFETLILPDDVSV